MIVAIEGSDDRAWNCPFDGRPRTIRATCAPAKTAWPAGQSRPQRLGATIVNDTAPIFAFSPCGVLIASAWLPASSTGAATSPPHAATTINPTDKTARSRLFRMNDRRASGVPFGCSGTRAHISRTHVLRSGETAKGASQCDRYIVDLSNTRRDRGHRHEIDRVTRSEVHDDESSHPVTRFREAPQLGTRPTRPPASRAMLPTQPPRYETIASAASRFGAAA
jgi:hypothetical protein